MAVVNNELRNETRRVLASRQWSMQGAEIATGVGRGSIHRMSQGLNVGAEIAMLWADAIREDRGHWLRITGNPQIADLVAPATPPGATDTPAPAQRDIPDEELLQMLTARYDGGNEGLLLIRDIEKMSPEDRAEVYKFVRAYLRTREAAK